MQENAVTFPFARIITGILALAAVLCISPAAAQEPPVEISAADGLEWNRTARTYTARGDVIARRGETEVRSDTLTAFYDEAGGSTDISRIEAAGSVIIASPPYRAWGSHGVYTVATGNAVLTGDGLKIETDNAFVTARDSVTYDAAARRMTARGRARAVNGAQTLEADTLAVFFTPAADGSMTTQTITAAGNIVITTANETVTGDAGVYNVPAQTAELTGNVRILQDESRLEGTRATVDMRTGISRLFAENNEETDGRVKGVFYPRKKEQN